MASYRELVDYNPWWVDPGAINRDAKIRDWKDSELRWTPELFREFHEEDRIYTLRGPRQVGKTTMIKMMIRERLAGGRNPWTLMYYSFDAQNSPDHVVDVLSTYLDRSAAPRRGGRATLFLDEISNITGWQRGVKKLKDMGRLECCTVVATGSHSRDLRRGSERMPGRRGAPTDEQLDKVMSPIGFGEYVSAVDPHIRELARSAGLAGRDDRLGAVRDLAAGRIGDAVWSIAAGQNALHRHLNDYLITGGIPTAINDHRKNGVVRDSVYEEYLKSVSEDMLRVYRTDRCVQQLIPGVIKRMCSPVSWNALRRGTDIASGQTVERYVEDFARLFVLMYVYRYDADAKSARYDKDKKIYFQDPFFVYALNAQNYEQRPFMASLEMLEDPGFAGRIVEGVVASHAVRLAYNMSRFKGVFDHRQSVFYWRSVKGREVDLVVRSGGVTLPIEVKYQDRIKSDDMHGIIDFKKASRLTNALMVTKEEMGVRGDVVLIPASVFLFLI